MTTSARPAALTTFDGRPAAQLWSLEPSSLHLNHGSFGAAPRVTVEERERLLREVELNPLRWHLGVRDRIVEARTSLAAFLGVDAQELAFVPNTSAGTTAVLRAAVTGPVLITNHAYGALASSARATAARAGTDVRVVDVPLSADRAEVLDRVAEALVPEISMFVVDQITSPTARLFPVEELAALAAERGVPILVDAAHAPGMLPGPAAAPVDAWVGNLHKFACGVRGAAAIVLRGSWASRVQPPTDSWAIDEPFPAPFDVQGTIDATSYLATVFGIAQLEELLGWERIRDHQHAVLRYSQELIAEAFGDATGEDHRVSVAMPAPAMGLVRLPDGLVSEAEGAGGLRARIADELAVETQIASWGGSDFLRISSHAYSTAEDAELFVERAVPALLGWAAEGARRQRI